jgi:UDP-N-acetyl-D-glucosamine dehydrogenase
VDDIHADARLVRVKATREEILAADAVVLLAEHTEFDYDTVVADAQFVLDCRNRLNGENVEGL